jgi:hypothetical protein
MEYAKLYKVCVTDDHSSHSPIHLFTLFTKKGEPFDSAYNNETTEKMINHWSQLHSMIINQRVEHDYTLWDLTTCKILRHWEGCGVTAYEYEHDVNNRLSSTGNKYYYFDKWEKTND